MAPGHSAGHLSRLAVELDELRAAETARQKQESLQATLKKFDETLATDYAARKRPGRRPRRP